MMHKSLAVKVFVDKALIVDHRRIVAAVRSITDAILAGSLLPDQKSIPCLIAGKCLKEE
jgi:hypothetical protein